MKKLSVVLAVYNEEQNLKDCLDCIKEIASEIVIVDGGSTDKTVEVAKSFGAKIIETNNPPIFHINKQKALDAAKYEWILQLDADERVTKKSCQEILKVIEMDQVELEKYQSDLKDKRLFLRHQKLLEERDGHIGTNQGDYVAFFFPRLNFFLGKYLRYGGVYPDGAIRLVKKGFAHFPCKSVHEMIEVDGKVGWLQYPMYHIDSPTFERYLARNNRYINLIVDELKNDHVKKNITNFIKWVFVLPISWFLTTQIRNKGILDGYQGILFSFFSALRFPRAYIRYMNL